MKQNILGIDIGGTKCAVIFGIEENDTLRIVEKNIFPTTDVNSTISGLFDGISSLMTRHGLNPDNTGALGISCGGPLDSRTGIIMSPPNLSGWYNIPIVKMMTDRFGIRTAIQNDANACALAEWKFGAGKGTTNMAFLTFGTGLGAGLILDGKLYSGTNDNAGEVGHIRLSDFGPVGYGKQGSFEGFCSGGGIAQLARAFVTEKLQMGCNVPWCSDLASLTAKEVAKAAEEGDELAEEIYVTAARFMGKGLAIMIDMLNPEMIVIGGIYTRNEKLMRPHILSSIAEEALPFSAERCKICSATLGENIGDFAALSVAANILNLN